jgi:hypothetical protein
VCEDGGPGSTYDWCQIGTDCADCAIRKYHSCAIGCFSHLLSDGVCDVACNVFDCNHNDCSFEEVIGRCRQLLSPALRESPRKDLPMELAIRLKPMTFVSDADTSETYVEVHSTTWLQWEDARLFQSVANPCIGVSECRVMM